MRVHIMTVVGVAILGLAIVVAPSRDRTKAGASTNGTGLQRNEQPKRLSSGRGTFLSSKSQRVSRKVSSEQLIRRAEFFSDSGDHDAAIEIAKLAMERAPECEDCKRVIMKLSLRRAVSLRSEALPYGVVAGKTGTPSPILRAPQPTEAEQVVGLDAE